MMNDRLNVSTTMKTCDGILIVFDWNNDMKNDLTQDAKMMDLIDDVVLVNNYCCLYGFAFVSCVLYQNLDRSKTFRWAHRVNGCDNKTERNEMFAC